MPNESPLTGPGSHAGPVPGDGGQPVVSVIRGKPTDAELAAVIAVLAKKVRARAAAAWLPTPASASRSAWSMRSSLVRESLTPGPGAWKRSALPR